MYIWLGANVMLAYPMDEAETLLVERLGKAKKSLVDCEEDAEFLREQITVSRPCPISTLPRAHTVPDHGGRNGQGVQLGCRAEAQGEGRGGEQREGREGRRWLSGPHNGRGRSLSKEKCCCSCARHGSALGTIESNRNASIHVQAEVTAERPMGTPNAEDAAENNGGSLERADSGMACSKKDTTMLSCRPAVDLE